MKKYCLFLTILLCYPLLYGQTDTRIYEIIDAVSTERIQEDITTLAGFGTRHTLSDTVSQTRG
ncbi:MAG: peptidase M28, partial [Robiginitalea sp.]